MTHPNRHKMAIVTWIVVYPLITLLLMSLEPLLQNIALPIRTFVLSAIMVPVMVYMAMPFATSHLSAWLRK